LIISQLLGTAASSLSVHLYCTCRVVRYRSLLLFAPFRKLQHCRVQIRGAWSLRRCIDYFCCLWPSQTFILSSLQFCIMLTLIGVHSPDRNKEW